MAMVNIDLARIPTAVSRRLRVGRVRDGGLLMGLEWGDTIVRRQPCHDCSRPTANLTGICNRCSSLVSAVCACDDREIVGTSPADVRRVWAEHVDEQLDPSKCAMEAF